MFTFQKVGLAGSKQALIATKSIAGRVRSNYWQPGNSPGDYSWQLDPVHSQCMVRPWDHTFCLSVLRVALDVKHHGGKWIDMQLP